MRAWETKKPRRGNYRKNKKRGREKKRGPESQLRRRRRLCCVRLGMNRKFGGGRPPTGTPSLAWSSAVVVASLLAGASVVHNLYKPDLVRPLSSLLSPLSLSHSLSLSHTRNQWYMPLIYVLNFTLNICTQGVRRNVSLTSLCVLCRRCLLWTPLLELTASNQRKNEWISSSWFFCSANWNGFWYKNLGICIIFRGQCSEELELFPLVLSMYFYSFNLNAHFFPIIRIIIMPVNKRSRR